MVQDVLLLLPSFKQPGPYGNSLLSEIQTLASKALKDDLAVGGASSLPNTTPYLRLANSISVQQPAAHPVKQVSYYLSSNLLGRVYLQRMTKDTQQRIIAEATEALEACGKVPTKTGQTEQDEIIIARNRLVEACSYLFEVSGVRLFRRDIRIDELPQLLTKDLSQERTCRACCALLTACLLVSVLRGLPLYSLLTFL